MAPAVFLSALVAGLVAFHDWARKGVAPIHDAATWVALASRLGLEAQHGPLEAAAALHREPNAGASLSGSIRSARWL